MQGKRGWGGEGKGGDDRRGGGRAGCDGREEERGLFSTWFDFPEGSSISNFMKIGPVVQKLQHFFEFQYGGRR